jgi:hypothetical protein
MSNQKVVMINKNKKAVENWEIENALKALAEARRRSGLDLDRKPTPLRSLIHGTDNYITRKEVCQEKSRICQEVVKTYVELNLAALNAGEEKIIRVWYLARFLDKEGCGVVLAEKVEELLSCSRRNFQRLLCQGEGKYWQRCKAKRGVVLILFGLRRVSRRLGVSFGRKSRPVLIPLEEFVRGVRRLRAALYASVHALRDERPISRGVLRKITGVPERTQREYDKVAGVEIRRNFALADSVSEEEEKRAFLVRLRGRMRWGFQIPNSYGVSYLHAPKGMVHYAPPSKRGLIIDYYYSEGGRRMYFRNPKKIVRAIERRHAQGEDYPLYFRLRKGVMVQWWSRL